MTDGARTPAMSRRAAIGALAAVAGGVAGSGVTYAAVAQGSGPTAGATTPGEDLMAEHGVLKRVLLVYRELSRRAHAGGSVPAAVLHDAAGLIHRFIEGFHEALEETYIFPALLAARRETALVKVLLAQHAAGRLITQDLLTLDATGTLSTDRTQYATDRLDAFVRMYEPHEAREDTVVFPAYRAITNDADLADIAERFADLQTSQLGPTGFTTAVDQVAALESRLGIADLSQFTPTLT